MFSCQLHNLGPVWWWWQVRTMQLFVLGNTPHECSNQAWPRLIKGWPVGDSSFPISTILCVFGLSMGIEHIHPLYCCSLVLQSLDVWTHCWTSDYWLYKLGESSCWSLGMSHLCWHDGFLADRSQGSNSNSWCPKIVSLSLIDYYCRHY